MEFDLAPSAPEDQHRAGPGWLVFFALVSLIIGLQLVSYLWRDTGSQGDRTAATADRSLKLDLDLQAAMRQILRGQAPKPDYRSAIRSLPKLEAPGASADAAVVAVAIRRLTGGEPKPASMEKLIQDKRQEYRSVAILAKRPAPPESKVRELKDKLPDLFSAELTWGLALENAGVKNGRDEVLSLKRGTGVFVLLAVIVVAAGLGVIAWIVYFGARLSGRLKPVGHAAEPVTSADADRMAARATQLLALFFLVPMFVGMVAGELPRSASIGVSFVVILLTLLVVGLPIFGKRFSMKRIGIHRRDLGKGVLWAFGALLAEIPLLILLALLSFPLQRFFPAPEHPITVVLSEESGIWTLVAIFVAASVMAPIVEEIIFRGLLAPAMVRLFRSFAVGLIVAALIFAAIHPTGVPAWLPLAGIGFMSSLLAYQTGSLIPSMIMHGVHNAVILTFTLLVLG